MSRLDAMGAALVAELQAWLYDAECDAVAAPAATETWLHTAPREEIRRTAGYVKPNPCDDVAMYLAGEAHSACPDWCEGCTCHVSPPCGHCTDHEPPARCGCPAFELDDTGQHRPECTRDPAEG